MRRAAVVLSLSALLLGSPTPAGAEDRPISEAYRRDVETLLELTGAENLGRQLGTALSDQVIDLVSRQYPDVPAATIAIIKEETSQVIGENLPLLTAQILPIYARHFSHGDVRGMIEFYRTPLGQRAVQTLPLVMQESMRAGQAWGEALAPQIQTRLEARLRREGVLVTP